MLPETVRALAAGEKVAVATLFQFNFLVKTMRFWDGLGYLTAGGHEWQGSGRLISASGLEQSIDLSAPQATFKLTGANEELVLLASLSEYQVAGRPCSVYAQFLTSSLVPLDQPIAVWGGIMDVMSFSLGVKDRVISLSAETLFTGRTRATYGFMTDTDQQSRWPGDVGFEFTAQLVNKTVTWLRG